MKYNTDHYRNKEAMKQAELHFDGSSKDFETNIDNASYKVKAEVFAAFLITENRKNIERCSELLRYNHLNSQQRNMCFHSKISSEENRSGKLGNIVQQKLLVEAFENIALISE